MQILVGDVSLWFDVDGAKWVVDGEGLVERPTLLLLHGGPGFDHSVFKPEFQALTDCAQLVFLDQRGQGRSSPGDPAHWNLDTWADDVAAFCRALAIEKPVLLGVSFGGFVALATAARRPDLAAGIITLGGTAHVERQAAVDQFGELGGPEAAKAASDFFARPQDEKAFAEYSQRCLPLYAKNGFNPVKMKRALVRREVLVNFFRPGGEYGGFDYRAGLENCLAPTLLLHGERDPIVPLGFAERTAASFPAGVARLLRFDCSHDVIQDEQEATLAAIRKFVRGLKPG